MILARGGKLREEIPVHLQFTRDPADDDVALMKAEVLRKFEELDLIAT